MFNVKSNFLWLAFATLTMFAWSCNNTPAPVVVNQLQAQARYGKDATVFSLCWLANINGRMMGTPEALQQHATSAVSSVLASDTTKNLIGTWTPVWGPVTYTHDPGKKDSCITDNTMMLLKGNDPADPSKTMYVVAIAGTNSVSVFDWAKEDFAVLYMVKWPAPPAAGANNLAYFQKAKRAFNPKVTGSGNYISNGICTGINNLMNNMTDGSKGTLIEYLKNNVGNTAGATEITVAGHSLGGGLSPVVALALKDNQAYWNPGGNFTITTYPFAGQSPGNKNFAQYFSQQFSGKFFGKYNVLDVVPHGFDSTMMPEIPTLYDKISPFLGNECVFSGVIKCMNKKVAPFAYTTLYQPANKFDGQVKFDAPLIYYGARDKAWEQLGAKGQSSFGYISKQYCPGDSVQNVFGRTGCFAIMALEQHVTAYIDYYGITAFTEVMKPRTISNAPATNILPDLIKSSWLIEFCL